MEANIIPCFDDHRTMDADLEPDITSISALIADSARSKMLLALMSGKAYTASELADWAGITAQTASSHLNKLRSGQLVHFTKQGRHKYFRLNSKAAELLESLMVLSEDLQPIRTGPKNPELRLARVCYDHLAGQVAVDLYDFFQQNQYVNGTGNSQMTEKGLTFFERLGLPLSKIQKARRPVCRTCLDWSERRFHLAGSLGQHLLDFFLNQNWIERNLDSRAMHILPKGKKAMKSLFLIEFDA